MEFLPALLIAMTAILVAANAYFILRNRKTVRAEPYYHFRCPGCRHRLRYREKQAGKPGMCRRCKARWTFPPIPKPSPTR